MSIVEKMSKKTFIVIIVISLIMSIIVILYPRRISFGKDILNKYIKENVEKIRITNSTENITKRITDKKELSSILQSLSEIEMVQYKKNIPANIEDAYYIGIYTGKDIIIGLSIYNGDYLDLFINSSSVNHSNSHKRYKILKGRFNIEYIKSLF